ncbi:hypothetical protein K2X16_16405, partial [Proteus mirabilis]|uniref:hypothetical protein n=1 Tax=Proteus mirabilis TaxID=584 RepID=UPI001C6F764D
PSLKCLALSDARTSPKIAPNLLTRLVDFFKPSRSVPRSTRATEVKKSGKIERKGCWQLNYMALMKKQAN